MDKGSCDAVIPRARPSRGRRAPVPSVRWRVCVVTERRNAFTRTLTHRLAHVRSGSDRSAAASQLQNYLQRHRGPCPVMTGTRKRRSNRFRSRPRPSTWRNRGTFTDTVASISKNVTEIHTGTLNRINQTREQIIDEDGYLVTHDIWEYHVETALTRSPSQTSTWRAGLCRPRRTR